MPNLTKPCRYWISMQMALRLSRCTEGKMVVSVHQGTMPVLTLWCGLIGRSEPLICTYPRCARQWLSRLGDIMRQTRINSTSTHNMLVSPFQSFKPNIYTLPKAGRTSFFGRAPRLRGTYKDPNALGPGSEIEQIFAVVQVDWLSLCLLEYTFSRVFCSPVRLKLKIKNSSRSSTIQ